jgi:Family of unknown function (DUF6196)
VVAISRERAVQSERRLRRVLRAAEVVHLDGVWSFRRFAGEVPTGALATVKDTDGWSALVAGSSAGAEHFALTRTTFSPVVENSGFVGWLATTVKRRLGSGVFVVCGDNPARGGIFDYWGYPVEVAGAVREVIDDLREGGPRDLLDLDLRVFEVVETSSASAISNETVFEFRERDGVVEASYAGGEVVRGFLTGRREGDRVATAYAHLHAGGELRAGTADVRIEPRPGGRLRLIEDFAWSDGPRGRNVLETSDDT